MDHLDIIFEWVERCLEGHHWIRQSYYQLYTSVGLSISLGWETLLVPVLGTGTESGSLVPVLETGTESGSLVPVLETGTESGTLVAVAITNRD
jgi:hypothetical protein